MALRESARVLSSARVMAKMKISFLRLSRLRRFLRATPSGPAQRPTVIQRAKAGTILSPCWRGLIMTCLAGLIFDSQNFAFVNVGMDISSIDVPCQGGPFGIADPIFRVSAIDSPDGTPQLTGTVQVLMSLLTKDSTKLMGCAHGGTWRGSQSSYEIGT